MIYLIRLLADFNSDSYSFPDLFMICSCRSSVYPYLGAQGACHLHEPHLSTAAHIMHRQESYHLHCLHYSGFRQKCTTSTTSSLFLRYIVKLTPLSYKSLHFVQDPPWRSKDPSFYHWHGPFQQQYQAVIPRLHVLTSLAWVLQLP